LASASLIAGFDPEKQPIHASPLAELLGEYIGVHSVDRYVNMVWTDTRRDDQDAFGSRFSGFYPPFPTFPAKGSYTVEKTPLLQWQAIGYYDTSVSFTLQIASDPNFAAVETTITGISTTSYQSDSMANRAYYWRVKGFDASGDSSLYSRTFSFTIYTEGDADSDGLITLADVIFLVNYLFREGSEPVPLIAGDPNCDLNATLPDVIYLVNHVFDRDRPATGCLGSDPGNCWTPCNHL
jgi:hypothetical protein